MARPEDIYAGLIARGLTPAQAEGVVMNLGDESGFDPGVNEVAPIVPGSRGGYGLAQWTGPRRNALEDYARASGRPVSDVDLQLDFLMQELRGPEQRAYQSLLAASTPGEAAAAFATDFLRPAKSHLDRRVADYTGGGGMDFSGNALRQTGQQPDPTENVLRLYAEAMEQPERQGFGAQLWNGLDPALFMRRRT